MESIKLNRNSLHYRLATLLSMAICGTMTKAFVPILSMCC